MSAASASNSEVSIDILGISAHPPLVILKQQTLTGALRPRNLRSDPEVRAGQIRAVRVGQYRHNIISAGIGTHRDNQLHAALNYRNAGRIEGAFKRNPVVGDVVLTLVHDLGGDRLPPVVVHLSASHTLNAALPTHAGFEAFAGMSEALGKIPTVPDHGRLSVVGREDSLVIPVVSHSERGGLSTRARDGADAAEGAARQ